MTLHLERVGVFFFCLKRVDTTLLSIVFNIYIMQEIQNKIQELESQLTGNMFADMNVKDEIHNLKMKMNGTKPPQQEIDCIGCGS
jgi:hypothetical protein